MFVIAEWQFCLKLACFLRFTETNAAEVAKARGPMDQRGAPAMLVAILTQVYYTGIDTLVRAASQLKPLRLDESAHMKMQAQPLHPPPHAACCLRLSCPLPKLLIGPNKQAWGACLLPSVK